MAGKECWHGLLSTGLKSSRPETGVFAHTISTIFLIQKTYSIDFFAAVREVMTLFTVIYLPLSECKIFVAMRQTFFLFNPSFLLDTQ